MHIKAFRDGKNIGVQFNYGGRIIYKGTARTNRFRKTAILLLLCRYAGN